MINSIIFSPSGTTAKVAETLTGFLDSEAVTYNLTVGNPERIDVQGDITIFAMPVYAGRIPALAVERLKAVRGNGGKAVAVVVYGNRDYDDALLELCDTVTALGFEVIAAGAFIAQHCIFPKVATGRPDDKDTEKLSEFAAEIRRKIGSGEPLDPASVKGNRPYKKAKGVPLHPEVNKKKCNGCATCARECPTGAIDAENPLLTDASRCITCCRCINVCPRDARRLGGLLYRIAGIKFVSDNSRRLEPEWFV